jgi:hypothetical protein
MAEPKVYVGKGKAYGSYGCVKISIKIADLKPNDKGWINLVVSPLKQPDQWKNTHTIYVDDWRPSGGNQQAPQSYHSNGQETAPPPVFMKVSAPEEQW